MKARILIAAVLLLVCHASVFSQGAVMRVLSYNGPGNGADQVTALVMNYDGSVYVTGYSKGSTSDEDFATIKFNNYGDFLWVSRFNGTGNYTDRATAIAVDNSGNVYVTGWAHMEPLDANDEILCGTIDFVTIKYDPYGNQMWMKVYAGPGGGDDIPNAISVDRLGNVYVTGSSVSSNKEDYLTIKYNNNGVQQWVARYDGVSHDIDVAYAFALGGDGGIYVTGKSFKSGQMADYVTVKYNNAGIQEWACRYNGPGNGDDISYSVAVDVNNNSFITGTSKGSTSNSDYATVKIGPNGAQLWAKRYNGPGNGIDEARSLVIDPYGSCYVTGFSLGTASNYDYATLKYDPDGNEIWSQRYNGPGNSSDKAWKIGLVKKPCAAPYNDYPCWNFDLYVTGQSTGSGTGNDFLTIKYDQFGIQKWTCRYASAGAIEDISTTNALRDDFGYFYAAGMINNNYGIVQISNRSSITDDPMTVRAPEPPKEFSLGQNYPNPFNPTTVIGYEVPNSGPVEINVYDILGKQVSNLIKSYMEPGRYNVSFDASGLPSGTYIYTIKAGNYFESKKMVLMK